MYITPGKQTREVLATVALARAPPLGDRPDQAGRK